MAAKLYGLALWITGHAKRMIAVWLLVLIAVAGLGTAFKGTLSTAFSIPGTESQEATDLLASRFPEANGGSLRVVFQATSGATVTAAQAKAAITASTKRAATVAGVVAVSDPATTGAVSASKTIAFSDVTFESEANDVTTATIDKVETAFAAARTAGLSTNYTGPVLKAESGGAAEAGGVVVAYAILAITLVSLLAAGLPLLTALIGVGLGLLGIQFVSGFVTLTSTTTALATMLGLAVGIDYALFIVARHRQQLRDPDTTVIESIARATATAGSAVVFAGVTVIIALVALLVAGIPFLSSMGLGAAATVAIAVLIAITLVPATLAVAGERLRPRRDSWFRRPMTSRTATALRSRSGRDQFAPTRFGFEGTTPASAPENVSASWAGKWARLVTRAPALVIIMCVAGIGVLASPALHMRLGLAGAETQPAANTQHKAYDQLARGFGPGFNATLVGVVDVRDIPAASRTATVTALTAKLKTDAGLATVSAPVYDTARTVALITLIPTTGPDDKATSTLVHHLRADDKAIVTAAGGSFYVAGLTATNIDVSAKLSSALPIYIAVIAVLAMLLLTIAFRTIVVPVKAIVGFLLSVAASTGITVFIFQDGHLLGPLGIGGAAPILCFLPVLQIGVLFGLAMDYEVFLVSRIREAFHHGGNARHAVLEGMHHSGRVVTAAALIMGSVFAAFALAPDPVIKSIAVALTTGVVIDAFVVRLTLVPAVMHLLGNTAWYMPKALDRIVPDVDIEGANLPARTAPAAAEETALVGAAAG